LVPLRAIRQENLIQSIAISVNTSDRTVSLANGQILPYDGLVIATGARNFSPAEPPINVNDRKGTVAYFETIGKALLKAKSVVIVGSGSVGLELAGELREFGQPGVKITVVSRSKQILTEPMKFKQSGIETILRDLKNLKIDVINSDEVASHPLPRDLIKAHPVVETPQGVNLRSGKHLDCELLVFTVGTQLNTGFLPSDWVDKITGEVLVDEETLQLQAHKNIFAVGDVAKTGTSKRAYFAGVDGAVVAANIAQVLQGQQPTNKISRMNAMLLTLGSTGGRLLLPYLTLGPCISAKLKSQELGTRTLWADLAPGLTLPQSPKNESPTSSFWSFLKA